MITDISKISTAGNAYQYSNGKESKVKYRTVQRQQNDTYDRHPSNHLLKKPNQKTQIRDNSKSHTETQHNSQIQGIWFKVKNLMLIICSNVPMVCEARYGQ